MNTRLQKLMDQSFTDEQGERFDPEKFAQLIVAECADVAYKAYWDNPDTVRGTHIKEQIHLHFEIE